MINFQIRIVSFSDNCTHKILIANKKSTKECPSEKILPTIVLVEGKGVLTRDIGEDKTIKNRILNNDSLYWSEDINRKKISFIRKEQVGSQIADFSNVLEVKIIEKVDDDLIREIISNFYSNTLSIKNLIRYKDDCKKILPHLIKKIEIPYVVILFVILLTNFLINSDLSEKNSNLQMDLLTKRQLAKNLKNKQTNESKFLLENQSNRDFNATIMIDSICAKQPSSIKLKMFTIDPLKGKLEANRPMKVENRVIYIIGITTKSNDIPAFVNRIESLKFVKEVKIKNIVQKKDSKDLEFEVEIKY